jgi:LPS sulfotransferase NodH
MPSTAFANRSNISGADFDLPAHFGPTRTVLLAATPRTGSSLLGHALAATGRCGVPFEYFNPVHMKAILDRTGLRTVDVYVRWLKRHRTTPNGVFGLKAHYDQWAPAIDGGAVDWRRSFGPMQVVWLTRADRVRQATSYARAAQSRAWHADLEDQQAPEYHFGLIFKHLRASMNSQRQWLIWLKNAGIQSIPVEYLELRDNYSATVGRVLRALGLDDGTPVPPPMLQRMERPEPREWAVRFREEAVGKGLKEEWLGPAEEG